ncbi:hypothetical protein BDQ17DRAFT_1237068 [Cyathus striatus]|nr:hypothetical protein BDQ17DRAFT_1237068 [Cyathus striatus]
MNYELPHSSHSQTYPKGTEERRNEHIHGALRTESPEPIRPEDVDIRAASTSATSRSTGSARRTRTGNLRQPDFASQNAHEYPPPPPTLVLSQQWHPKLTLYRLLVILTTLGFGISKAVLSYQGHSIVPITLEWLFTTGVFLLCVSSFSLTFSPPHTYNSGSFHSTRIKPTHKSSSPGSSTSISATLYGNASAASLALRTRRFIAQKYKHPPIRGYDLLVTLSTTVLGMTKSILAYQGRNTAVATVEWLVLLYRALGAFISYVWMWSF